MYARMYARRPKLPGISPCISVSQGIWFRSGSDWWETSLVSFGAARCVVTPVPWAQGVASSNLAAPTNRNQ
jgi:hypothetical protein